MSLEPRVPRCPPDVAALTRQALDHCLSMEEKALVALAGYYNLSTTSLRMLHNGDIRPRTETEGLISTTGELGMRVEVLVTGETWQYIQHIQRTHPFRARPEMPLFLGRIRLLPEATREALRRGEYVKPDELRRTKPGVSDLFRRTAIRMGWDGKSEGFVHDRRLGKNLNLLERLREGWKAAALSGGLDAGKP